MNDPRIVIVAGSESDLSIIMKSEMLDVIAAARIDFIAHVASAHRNPDIVARLGEKHEGVDVIIAIAGLAAALPGALAGATRMRVPVIAVPLDEHGIDSCIWMPPGVPVLTAGVGKTGLKNAAIAAVQISARSDEEKAGFQAWLDATAKQAKLNIDLSPEVTSDSGVND